MDKACTVGRSGLAVWPGHQASFLEYSGLGAKEPARRVVSGTFHSEDD